MPHYKDTDESKIALLAALYDCSAMIGELAQRVIQLEKTAGIGRQTWVTRHWSQPTQDVDGDWTLPKPTELECGTIERVGGCVVVDDPEFPEETP